MRREMKIGELSEATGVSRDTIRYYGQEGLLSPASRTHAGYRLYTEQETERLRFIRQAQSLGFSLAEIKQLLTGGGGATECQSVRDLLSAKLNDVDARIKTMREFRRTLARHLEKCESELNRKGTQAHCPVLVEITHQD